MDSICTHAVDLTAYKKLAYYKGDHTTVRTEAMTDSSVLADDVRVVDRNDEVARPSHLRREPGLGLH